MRELMQDLWATSPQQAVLRVLVVVSLLSFGAVVLLAGETDTWALVVMAGLGVVTAINPHSGFPAVVMIYVMAVWAVGVETAWSPWALLAAPCLLVFHTACALAAATPARGPFPSGLWRRYAVRVGLLTTATALLWALAFVVETASPPGGVVTAVVGLAVLSSGLGLHHFKVARAKGADRPTQVRQKLT